MDRSWMEKSRVTEEYQNGLKFFLDYAFRNASMSDGILCPCKRCKIVIFATRDEAFEHLTVDGFISGYTQWIAHGELSSSRSLRSENQSTTAATSNDLDDMQGLVHDAFGVPNIDSYVHEGISSPLDADIAKGQAEEFYKLIDASQERLYEGCEKFSKLSFMIRLLHLKCLGRLNNRVFDKFLELLGEAFLDAMLGLPKSYYEANKLMKELGLGYEKIDACPNDCTLYWGTYESKISCDTCHELRWCTSDKDPTGEKRKVAHKVLGISLSNRGCKDCSCLPRQLPI